MLNKHTHRVCLCIIKYSNGHRVVYIRTYARVCVCKCVRASTFAYVPVEGGACGLSRSALSSLAVARLAWRVTAAHALTITTCFSHANYSNTQRIAFYLRPTSYMFRLTRAIILNINKTKIDKSIVDVPVVY